MNEKKTYYVNRKFKKAEEAILMSKKKKEFKTMSITRGKERHFIVIKQSFH